MKTVYVVLGIAAVGGAIWWYKNKRNAAQVLTDPAAATGVIPMPESEAEATKIIKLPDTLLQNTSGNTGIMPPIITGTASNKITGSVPTMQAQQPIVKQPIKSISKASTILPSKLTYLRGLGDAFILN